MVTLLLAMNYSLEQLQATLATDFQPPSHLQGKGIVIVAGGSTLPSAYVAIASIRAHGSQLPIQLWHLGVNEMPEKLKSIFEPLGVTCVNAHEVRKVLFGNPAGPWETKPFAILHSPFAEVLLVDADNMLMQNPDTLFSDATYKEHGNMFWPDFMPKEGDFWAIKESAWDLLNIEKQEGLELETGQAVLA